MWIPYASLQKHLPGPVPNVIDESLAFSSHSVEDGTRDPGRDVLHCTVGLASS